MKMQKSIFLANLLMKVSDLNQLRWFGVQAKFYVLTAILLIGFMDISWSL